MPQQRQDISNDPANPRSRHGLVTPADLGLSRAAIHDRVRRGALFRRYHGVYSLSPGDLSREGEWTAALMAAGEGATLSDLSAAVLSRVWRYPEEAIDVTLARRHVPIPGVRLHQRRLDPLDVVEVDGIRVTTVARTLVDLTDELLAEELTNVIHEAAFRNLFDLEATRRAMARANGRHRLRALEQAIEDYLDGSAGLKSRAERAFLLHVHAAGLPRPRVNVRVEGIEVDFHWPPTRREDERRDAELRSAGWSVMRIRAREIQQRPERVLGAVGCALATRPVMTGETTGL